MKMTSSHRCGDAQPRRAGKLTRDALRLLETGTPRCQTNRGVSVARPFAHGPRSLTSDGLYGSNLVLLWWRELNPRSWSEPNASPGLILLKNTHQRPWIMAFPSLPVSSEEQIRPRNCVLRLIVSCSTRQNHPPALRRNPAHVLRAVKYQSRLLC